MIEKRHLLIIYGPWSSEGRIWQKFRQKAILHLQRGAYMLKGKGKGKGV